MTTGTGGPDDTGHGGSEDSTGTGLRNLRLRLQRLYDGAAASRG